MSHEVEKMAYAYIENSNSLDYAHPWHKEWTGENSIPVDPSITAFDAAQKIDLLWDTYKEESFIIVGDKMIPTGTNSIYRNKNGKIDVLASSVGKNWEDYQNIEFVDFVDDVFINPGIGELNTIGSLQNGKLVFILVKIKNKDGFSLFNGKDVIEPYFLITNPHVYGQSVDFRLTMTRVVCKNTVLVALSEKTATQMRFHHNQSLDFDLVEKMLGTSDKHMKQYNEAAEFLASRKFDEERLVDFYDELFPLAKPRGEAVPELAEADEGEKVEVRRLSRGANRCMELLDTQPGAEFGAGTWWQAFNAVTYSIDHETGHNVDTRTRSAWYGAGRDTKQKALKKALDYAEAS